MIPSLCLVAILIAEPPKVKDASAASIYAELGIKESRPDATLPPIYAADGYSSEFIRLNSKMFPVRVAVLNAVDVLGKKNKIVRKSELHQSELTDTGKNKLMETQEAIAGTILLLDEANESLTTARAEPTVEKSKRWLAHHDYLSAVVVLESAMLEELNLAYGSVRANRLTPLDPKTDQTGWKLLAVDKMASKGGVRKLVDEAKERLEKVKTDYPNTPWSILASEMIDRKPGLNWDPQKVAMPVTPTKKPKK